MNKYEYNVTAALITMTNTENTIGQSKLNAEKFTVISS